MIELIAIFIEPLEQASLRYLVTGSVAAMIYGEPRLTNDIDLILEINSNDVATLTKAFPDTDYYLPPSEVIQSERVRMLRGHFNIIHLETMLKADVYLAGADPLHRWAFQHMVRLEIDGRQVVCAPPEYIILRKLEFYREGGSEKHLRDIASILTEAGAELDTAFLEEEVRTHGLSAAWQRANDLAQAQGPSCAGVLTELGRPPALDHEQRKR
ncbi:MAG: hypothetical protein NTW21_14940 [Verrucomicrobia bacterium]|nr:hypothetical protein [Verrucomicrobiota bacterium]